MKISIVEQLVRELVRAAKELGVETTKGGRRVYREELRKEFPVGSTEVFELGENEPEKAAREFIDLATEQDFFGDRTRVGHIVVKHTVDFLRERHRETKVCEIWPFC